MNRNGLSTTLLVDLEQSMIPTDPQSSTAKRKAPEDANPLANTSKRLRKESSVKHNSVNKRKLLNGEEQPGGLVIVRSQSTRPPSAQPSEQTSSSQHPPRPISTEPHSAMADPSHPPSKKFKSDSRPPPRRTAGKGKERDVIATARPEPEVDEDVRLMNNEAEHLRRRSRANAENLSGNLKADFSFPPFPKSSDQSSSAKASGTGQTHSFHARSKPDRNGLSGDSQNGRRKSSLSMRGKRASVSYEMSGVITQPHPSVSDSSFYKHIDCDLPEPQRARQLLIWCSSRAMARSTSLTTEDSSSGRKSKEPGKDPPPLSAEAVQVLKAVEEDVIRMLAEKKIDTNVYSPVLNDTPPKNMKPNQQNVKNREREIRFTDHIERAKSEDQAWAAVSQFYNSHQARVVAELESRHRSHSQSAKAKGKQRAVDDWEPRENELPDKFRGPDSVDLAWSILRQDNAHDPMSARLKDLEFTVDRLDAFVETSLHTTHYAEDDLNRRFALLSLSLATRSDPTPSLRAVKPGALSSFLPTSINRPAPTTDPQEMFRALSRVDAERHPAQVGDAARRAVREVQRVDDAPGGVSNRRLTEVAPPTPRKPPGTPRRATTPGRGR